MNGLVFGYVNDKYSGKSALFINWFVLLLQLYYFVYYEMDIWAKTCYIYFLMPWTNASDFTTKPIQLSYETDQVTHHILL